MRHTGTKAMTAANPGTQSWHLNEQIPLSGSTAKLLSHAHPQRAMGSTSLSLQDVSPGERCDDFSEPSLGMYPQGKV